MAQLLVTAKVPNPDALVGSSLLVEATLTSAETGADLVAVQSPEGDSRFEYQFSSTEHGELTVSSETFRSKRQQHGMMPQLLGRHPLRAGESITYTEDVAGYFVSPPPAGDYKLYVRWKGFDGELFAAPPIDVHVTAPRPTMTAQLVDLSGIGLVTAFVHAGCVYTREASSGRPDLGSAQIRHRASGGALTGLALASDLDDKLEWRWSAWLEAGGFGAAISWASSVVRSVAPMPHGLDEATLLPCGWQLAESTGFFVVLGTAGGKTFADLVQMPKGVPPQHHHIDLGGPLPVGAAAAMWRVAPGTVELLRVDSVDGALTVARQRLDLSQPRASAPVPFGTLPGPLLALALAPLLGTSPVFDVLVDAPAGAPPRLTYLRTPLGGGPATTWTLEPAPPVDGAPPGKPRYGLARVPHPAAPVLAQVGDSLFIAAAASDGKWSRVVQTKHGVSLPGLEHLSAPDGSDPTSLLFVTWFDGLRGFSTQDVSAMFAV